MSETVVAVALVCTDALQTLSPNRNGLSPGEVQSIAHARGDEAPTTERVKDIDNAPQHIMLKSRKEESMAMANALSRARSTISCLRGERATGEFWIAALRTLSGAGDFHAKVAVPLYPRDAQHQDLVRIGQDMYRAAGRHAEEAPTTRPS